MFLVSLNLNNLINLFSIDSLYCWSDESLQYEIYYGIDIEVIQLYYIVICH